jgi:hypothetical protein
MPVLQTQNLNREKDQADRIEYKNDQSDREVLGKMHSGVYTAPEAEPVSVGSLPEGRAAGRSRHGPR